MTERVTQIGVSEVVGQDRELAIQLYGHPLVALRYITADLERMIANEWTASYKREPGHLIAVLHNLRRAAEDGTVPAIEPLVEAARAELVEPVAIPKVVEYPVVQTAIEQAYKDWLQRRIQVKQGRWRHHYRGYGIRYRSRERWVTTLCDYDKDAGLRSKYPLDKNASYPPQSFCEDAKKWRDDFRQPQIENRERMLQGLFGELDAKVEKFIEYCQSAGMGKDFWWSRG